MKKTRLASPQTRRRLFNRFTFLVIRNADQSVKQFQISKLFLLSIPFIAIVTIAALGISIWWLTSYKAELTQQVEELELILEDKDGTILTKEASILNLQNEVLLLSSQTEDMQSRIEQIAELEKELQELISTFSDKKNTMGVQNISTNSLAYEIIDDERYSGGTYIPIDEERVLNLAEETHTTLTQMAEDLALTRSRIAAITQEAEEIKQLLDTTPSYWPTTSTRITSKFGYRKDPFTRKTAYHSGIDFGANYGDPVFAAGAGKVIEVGRNSSEGRYILIEHSNGLRSKYMHLSSTLVKKNDEVMRGETIGKAGSTGRSTGVHLHFEIHKNGKPIDPLPYLSDQK